MAPTHTQSSLTLDTPEYVYSTHQENFSNEYIWKSLCALLPTSPGTVLDVGCGNGFLTAKIAAEGHRVLGIDPSVSGIHQASLAYPTAQFQCYSAYDDLRKLQGMVDCVVSCEVIEHLSQPKLFLKNISEVLKPGGTLILSTPYHGYWKNLALSLTNRWDRHFGVDWDGGHIKFFSESSLGSLLQQAQFEKVSFRNAGRVPGFWKSIVCRATKP